MQNEQSHCGGVHPACRMRIIAQVNQTGEVRLLSKLLNQKVDTECCVYSREKTLTVQGLWVCKKTESSVKMHLQAAELLTFRYAYMTVLNQSKQKKERAGGVLCQWALIPPVFTHLQFMSSFFSQQPQSGCVSVLKNRLRIQENEVAHM